MINPAQENPPTTIMKPYQPHDLLWVNASTALISDDPLPSWVDRHWDTGLPVVVRRDHSAEGLIPVGIRGKQKHQRVSLWVHPDHIVKSLPPDALVPDMKTLSHSPFATTKPVRALTGLISLDLPFQWGPTGSCAYALATGQPVIHEDSDLDLTIRCPQPVLPEHFTRLAEKCKSLPCAIDIQIETPFGAFAFKEWMRENGQRVLIKTDFGPFLTSDPWNKNKDKK